MSLNKKIRFLLENKISPKTIGSLNDESISLLYEKFKKKETKEQAASANVQKINIPASTAYKVPSGGEVDINNVKITNQNGVTTVMPTSGKPVTETEEIEEKFESKAQQGLFWAKCNKCKTDDCKWCKMAKEFSKSTSKKQYEKMPEKKVKYKNTNEEFGFGNYLEKLGAAVTSKMGKETKGITPVWNESIFKKNVEKIIEQNLNPTMKKRDLLRLIEGQIKNKKSLSEDFYFPTNEAEADFGTITRYDTETKPSEKGEERKAYKYNYVAKDCADDKVIYIKTKEELYLESFYKIDYDGLSKCVQVLFDSEKGGKKTEVIDEIESCKSCEGSSEGGDRRFSMGQTSSETSSESGYKEFGGGERQRRTIKRHNPYERPQLDPQGDLQENLMIKRLIKNLKFK